MKPLLYFHFCSLFSAKLFAEQVAEQSAIQLFADFRHREQRRERLMRPPCF
jgi:hypothetical protein